VFTTRPCCLYFERGFLILRCSLVFNAERGWHVICLMRNGNCDLGGGMTSLSRMYCLRGRVEEEKRRFYFSEE